MISGLYNSCKDSPQSSYIRFKLVFCRCCNKLPQATQFTILESEVPNQVQWVKWRCWQDCAPHESSREKPLSLPSPFLETCHVSLRCSPFPSSKSVMNNQVFLLLYHLDIEFFYLSFPHLGTLAIACGHLHNPGLSP